MWLLFSMNRHTSWMKTALPVAGLLVCLSAFLAVRSPQQPAVQSGASSSLLPQQPPTQPTASATPPLPPAEEYTVDDRLRQYGEVVRSRLEPDFRRAGVPYPPSALTLIGLKEEKTLQVYAPSRDGRVHFIRSYPVLAASGHAGPKLCEGDLQVPEGLYRIESLNPNSLFHLALRVNYPNEFDRSMGTKDQRTDLGEDIMIHGNAVSVGCLAMGDQTAEDLFILAALTGTEHIQVVLSPVDFRVRSLSAAPDDPNWVPGLYERVKNELKKYQAAKRP